MKRNNRFFIQLVKLASLFLIFAFFSSQEFYADENGVTTAGFTFNITYPENQISDSGYLDLLMQPGQKQSVTFTLDNPLDEEVTVDLGISGAKTNKNGVVEYSPNEIPNDDSLKYPFETLVTGPEQITLKSKETKEVAFEITMPETEFSGRIVGGISMIRSAKDDKEQKAEGAQIINRYRYVAPVVLQVNQNPVVPQVKFKKAYAEQLNAKNSVFIDFSNIEPTFFNNMSIEVNITEKGKDMVLYETKKTNMRMAPNSLMTFPISMQGESMVAGDYTAKILVKGDKGINENWIEDFTITKEEADKYNERDIGLYEEKTTNWKLIALIVGGALALIAIIYIVISKMRKMKAEKEKQNIRKKRKATKSKQIK